MTAAQKRSLETLADAYCVPFAARPLDWNALFDNGNPVTIEIGFGGGEATVAIAEANPRKNYLGIEVFPGGVGRLLGEIEKRSLENVKIIQHDAVETLERMVPDNSAAAFHIFFPDPWPKKRHHKRRLVKRPFTDLLARKLSGNAANSAYVYMVTDWEDYAFSALEELGATPGLTNTSTDFAAPRDWRPETRFERKGISASRKIWELFFVKTLAP